MNDGPSSIWAGHPHRRVELPARTANSPMVSSASPSASSWMGTGGAGGDPWLAGRGAPGTMVPWSAGVLGHGAPKLVATAGGRE
jgi:hypothetical protein